MQTPLPACTHLYFLVMVDVVIVGAGLSGLNCARILQQHQCSVKIIEKADSIGGRVRTDLVDGFRLDHGFQVLLTAYPEARAALDYDRLNLKSLYNGALIRMNDGFHKVSDPLRHPSMVASTMLAPVGSMSDKMKIGSLRLALTKNDLDEIFEREEVTTDAALRERWGFSDAMIQPFFRPFLAGIMLDPNLGGSSRMFEFVFRMFARGEAALPANGMQAIPEQLAETLPKDAITLNATVIRAEGGEVTLESGKTINAKAIVLATEAPEAAALSDQVEAGESCSVACLYFAAPSPPVEEGILVLNGDGDGPINNLSVLSNAAPSYAPDGQSLISVSVLGNPLQGDDALLQSVQSQLASWYGAQTADWRHLRTYRVTYALPDQAPPFLSPPTKSARLAPGLYACGDYMDTASINGALAAGRRAAEAILADLV